MKIFAKRIKNNRGMTLVELLATFAIASIVLAIVYAVFINGLKTSNKVEAKNALRDDGDYVISTIMNELQGISADSINYCTPSTGNLQCIKLIDNKSIQVSQNSDTPSDFYNVEKKQKNTANEAVNEVTIEYGLKDKTNTTSPQPPTPDNRMYTFFINGKPIDIDNNLKHSTINFSCSSKDDNNQCTSAVFDLTLFISTTSRVAKFDASLDKYVQEKKDGKQPQVTDSGDQGWVELESQFGF